MSAGAGNATTGVAIVHSVEVMVGLVASLGAVVPSMGATGTPDRDVVRPVAPSSRAWSARSLM
jgi:hypothetical protein